MEELDQTTEKLKEAEIKLKREKAKVAGREAMRLLTVYLQSNGHEGSDIPYNKLCKFATELREKYPADASKLILLHDLMDSAIATETETSTAEEKKIPYVLDKNGEIETFMKTLEKELEEFKK